MTVSDMIKALSNFDPDTKVAVLTPNSQYWLGGGMHTTNETVVFYVNETGHELFEFEIGGRSYLAESMEHAVEQDRDRRLAYSQLRDRLGLPYNSTERT